VTRTVLEIAHHRDEAARPGPYITGPYADFLHHAGRAIGLYGRTRFAESGTEPCAEAARDEAAEKLRHSFDASIRRLLAAYPASGGALSQALAEAQARQAVTLAATLRYPTNLDAQLLHLLAPSGSHQLDWLTGCDPQQYDTVWRTWIDETVVSWAACLLADPALAARAAHQADAVSEHHAAGGLRRLTDPGKRDTEAAPLLRHPDLLENIAGLHRPPLLKLLSADRVELP
jgi:hypothetical protein